jgi:hypothetical protein
VAVGVRLAVVAVPEVIELLLGLPAAALLLKPF